MITVIVINWNGAHYLDACIGAISAQVPTPDEIILVDNHSDDGSRDLVAERFPSVVIHDTGSNLGPGGARNAGVEAATNETCVLVDNDVVLQAGAVQALVGRLEREPKAGMVQVRSLCADDETKIHYDWSEIHYTGTLILHNWFRPLATAGDPPAQMGGGIALAFATRKSTYQAVGGFRPELFIYYEDTDLAWRLRMAGYTLHLEATALAVHGGGTAGYSMRDASSYPKKRTWLHCRNRWLVLGSCMRWRTLILTLPAQFVYGTVYSIFALTRGHALACLRGHFAALAMLPQMLRWRRENNSRRVLKDTELIGCKPLSIHDGLADRGAKAILRRSMDSFFFLWWRSVRWLCG